MKQLNKDEFLNLIKNEVEQAGSQGALAAKWGVTQQYVNYVMNGQREPGPAILSAMNMVANVTYTAKDNTTHEERNAGLKLRRKRR